MTKGRLQTLRPQVSMLKPRLSVAPAARDEGKSWRLPSESSTARGYGYAWQQARLAFLWKNPLCVFCERAGRVELATVVDHIVPHRGDQQLFWDRGNWQSLCKHCHDSTKAALEKSGVVQPRIGIDGFSVDDGGGGPKA